MSSFYLPMNENNIMIPFQPQFFWYRCTTLYSKKISICQTVLSITKQPRLIDSFEIRKPCLSASWSRRNNRVDDVFSFGLVLKMLSLYLVLEWRITLTIHILLHPHQRRPQDQRILRVHRMDCSFFILHGSHRQQTKIAPRVKYWEIEEPTVHHQWFERRIWSVWRALR